MKQMLLFYLPLALPAALMGMSQSIVSGALARMEDAAVVLAAYTLAGGVTLVGESPAFPVRQLSLALVRDKRSWHIARAVAWTVTLTSFGIEMIVGWGPLMRPVFQSIFGVPDHLLAPSVTIFRLFMWITLISTWRFFYQGITVAFKQPLYITVGVVVRLPFMLLAAYGIVNYGWVEPLLAGPAIVMVATIVEASVAYIGARRIYSALPEQAEDPAPVTLGAGFRFFLPLVLSAVAWAIGRPLVNAAIGRSPYAEDALAALALSIILWFAVIGPLALLHQVTAVFSQAPGGRAATLRFAVGAGLVTTLLLALLGYTPAGTRFLISALAVPPHVEAAFVASIRPMIAFPLVAALSDHAQGLLLLERNSRLISLAKFAGVGTSVAVVWLLIGSTPTPAAAASLAVWAMGSASGTETLVLYRRPLFTQLKRLAYRG